MYRPEIFELTDAAFARFPSIYLIRHSDRLLSLVTQPLTILVSEPAPTSIAVRISMPRDVVLDTLSPVSSVGHGVGASPGLQPLFPSAAALDTQIMEIRYTNAAMSVAPGWYVLNFTLTFMPFQPECCATD